MQVKLRKWLPAENPDCGRAAAHRRWRVNSIGPKVLTETSD